MDQRVKEFLKELTELSKKYELTIGGCGCCGSPWVDECHPSQSDGSYEYTLSYNGNDCLDWTKKELENEV